jgi:hypothetical protein
MTNRHTHTHVQTATLSLKPLLFYVKIRNMFQKLDLAGLILFLGKPEGKRSLEDQDLGG